MALRHRFATFTALAVALALAFVPATAANAADGTVTGLVFRDFNANGTFDSGNGSGTGIANDMGFAGVTVTAYDDAGASWTTTSAADGTYSLSVVGSSGDVVRVEFTGLPVGYQPGAVTSTGADNGGGVQFVAVGSTSVDFSVNAPEDYSQAAAPLVTLVQWAGAPTAAEGGTRGTSPALVGIAYDGGLTGPQPAGFPGQVVLATFEEVGAIGGNLYHAKSDSIFTSAIYKRQSGLGSLGLGGIYQVTDVLDGNGQVSDAGGVVPWLDVEAIGIDVGTALSNAARGRHGHQILTHDPDAFAQAGKVGIGDMVLSPDGNTLYFVNLFDKRLYALDVSDPTVPPTTFQSFDLGLGVGERPWALTIYRDQLYVGSVDSGETAVAAQPGQSAAAAGLQAHVITAPLSALGGGFTEVLTADLGYAKGRVVVEHSRAAEQAVEQLDRHVDLAGWQRSASRMVRGTSTPSRSSPTSTSMRTGSSVSV